MSTPIIVISVIGLILLFFIITYYSPTERRNRERLDQLLSDRPKLSHEEYRAVHFPESAVTSEIIAKVREMFDEQFGLDLKGLGPDDDLSTDYSIIWEMDSLADVEILVGLEKEFGIEISSAEAAKLRSLRMIADLVADKLAQAENEKNANKPCDATGDNVAR